MRFYSLDTQDAHAKPCSHVGTIDLPDYAKLCRIYGELVLGYLIRSEAAAIFDWKALVSGRSEFRYCAFNVPPVSSFRAAATLKSLTFPS